MSQSQEYITYKGIPSINTACNVQKQLELQRWILDPSLIPYDRRQEEQRLVSRSASTEIKQQSIVEKQLALQRMIIADYP